MRNGSYVDYLFGVATGWLGGGKAQQHAAPKQKASVADRLKAFLRGRQEP